MAAERIEIKGDVAVRYSLVCYDLVIEFPIFLFFEVLFQPLERRNVQLVAIAAITTKTIDTPTP